MAKKNLRTGVKHPRKDAPAFIGANIDIETYEAFKAIADADGRSVSSMLRRVLEEKILSGGVKHPEAGGAK